MLNHFRTLLLNASPNVGGYPGEEFVPPAFKPLVLTGALEAVRNVLFGLNPDRLMLNYRVQQLLAVIESTELRSFVTKLDSRLTYDPLRSDSLYRHSFQLQADQISGDQVTMYFGGEPGLTADATGQCRLKWRVTLPSINSAAVRRLTAPLREDVYPFDLVDGLSTPIPLTGTDFFFTFHVSNDAIDWETMTLEEWLALTEEDWEAMIESGGAGFLSTPIFSVSADVRPQYDVATLLTQLDALGEPTLLRLFGVGSPQGASEPLATFRRLWTSHREPSQRLGAAVCALVYQTERVRNG